MGSMASQVAKKIAQVAKSSMTKLMALKIAPHLDQHLSFFVSKAIEVGNIDLLAPKQGKYLSKVLGYSLVGALRKQGISLDEAFRGVVRGAELAVSRLKKGETEFSAADIEDKDD